MIQKWKTETCKKCKHLESDLRFNSPCFDCRESKEGVRKFFTGSKFVDVFQGVTS